jgi:hypothetical protein
MKKKANKKHEVSFSISFKFGKEGHLRFKSSGTGETNWLKIVALRSVIGLTIFALSHFF